MDSPIAGQEVGENHFELNLKFSFVLFPYKTKYCKVPWIKVCMQEATNCILASCKTDQMSRNILDMEFS